MYKIKFKTLDVLEYWFSQNIINKLTEQGEAQYIVVNLLLTCIEK